MTQTEDKKFGVERKRNKQAKDKEWLYAVVFSDKILRV